MNIVSSNLKPLTLDNEISINITEKIKNSLPLNLRENIWIIISQEDILNAINKDRKILYTTTQKIGYTLYGSKPAYIDTNVKYFICNFAKAFENRPIITREDEKEYFGYNKWIVDFGNIIES